MAAKESSEAAGADREARDGAIWEADTQGATLAEIARATEMSTGHIQRVVVRETARRQVTLP
jgi:Mor family transcriptional regulator